MKEKVKDVDEKISPIRIVLFVIVFAVAIGAISFGVYRIGYKAPGYYSVTEITDDEAVMYGNDYELVNYFGGNSNQIKAAMNELSELYSSTLKRAYKLTDPVNEYKGYVNLATINKNPGQPQKVSEELFKMLRDADNRTNRQYYSLYAGALYAHWNSILYLSDALEYDPLVNADERERIKALAEETKKSSAVTLTFDEANSTVTLNVSPEYAAFCTENEESDVYLDFNLMRDAYILDMLYKELSDKGYTNGYITAKNGLYRALNAYSGGEYCMYTNNGAIEKYKTVAVTPDSCCNMFRSFPIAKGEMGYYTITADGKTYLRHPKTNLTEDGYNNLLQSSMVVSYESASDAVFYTCRLLAASEQGEIEAIETEFKKAEKNEMYYALFK